MYRLVEEMLKLKEQEDDRFDPKKNLRSKMINIFHEENYSFVGEQKIDLELYLEFKKDDIIVKVVIPV